VYTVVFLPLFGEMKTSASASFKDTGRHDDCLRRLQNRRRAYRYSLATSPTTSPGSSCPSSPSAGHGRQLSPSPGPAPTPASESLRLIVTKAHTLNKRRH
jgi:hypothetical protein